MPTLTPAELKALPSTERLAEVLAYDVETGEIHWRKTLSRRAVAGSPARCLSKSGYIVIRVDGIRYYAHRLIWKMMTGRDPTWIDHKNGKRNDNRWGNLRECTMTQNHANRAAKRPKGAFFDPRTGRWTSRIVVHGAANYLGTFDTAADAHAAYALAARAVHGAFARVS